ncbi:MAG: hypothetical protein Q9204_005175 [Flavoplaca sp. TL-2023a]
MSGVRLHKKRSVLHARRREGGNAYTQGRCVPTWQQVNDAYHHLDAMTPRQLDKCRQVYNPLAEVRSYAAKRPPGATVIPYPAEYFTSVEEVPDETFTNAPPGNRAPTGAAAWSGQATPAWEPGDEGMPAPDDPFWNPVNDDEIASDRENMANRTGGIPPTTPQ